MFAASDRAVSLCPGPPQRVRCEPTPRARVHGTSEQGVPALRSLGVPPVHRHSTLRLPPRRRAIGRSLIAADRLHTSFRSRRHLTAPTSSRSHVDGLRWIPLNGIDNRRQVTRLRGTRWHCALRTAAALLAVTAPPVSTRGYAYQARRPVPAARERRQHQR